MPLNSRGSSAANPPESTQHTHGGWHSLSYRPLKWGNCHNFTNDPFTCPSPPTSAACLYVLSTSQLRRPTHCNCCSLAMTAMLSSPICFDPPSTSRASGSDSIC